MSDVEIELERLLADFFGNGNKAWPGMHADYKWSSRVIPFVNNARNRQHGPLVLPRLSADEKHFAFYVIIPNPRETVLVTDLVRSFAGPTLIEDFDRAIVPMEPDLRDPIERGIAASVPQASIIKLPAAQELRTELTNSMLSMLSILAHVPDRKVEQIKPIGRLIAEFEAALASGGTQASLQTLQQIEQYGGITATNIAALKIRRLDKLGASRTLLEFEGLLDVLLQHVPGAVYESALNALWTEFVEEPISRDDLAGAISDLTRSPVAVRRFLTVDFSRFGVTALSVIALLASHFKEPQALVSVASILLDPPFKTDIPEAIAPLLDIVWPEAQGPAPTVTAETEVIPSVPVGSWIELIDRLNTFDRSLVSIDNFPSWASWPSPAADDTKLADAFDRLGDEEADTVWSMVGAFLDSIGYSEVAPLSARALIRNAIMFDRFSPGDLTTITALLEIALRSGMRQTHYDELLHELQSSYQQWSSPSNASFVLDLVDRLATAACPDEDARRNFISTVFGPLLRHLPRLHSVDRSFAATLTGEVGLDLDWTLATVDSEGRGQDSVSPTTRKVLLYSLDEGVLTRCEDQLERNFPSLRVTTSHDHVGGAQLKEKVRNADIVVIATRCAKHAATGFIGKYAEPGVIFYAQGSGSASLLRATYEALDAFAT